MKVETFDSVWDALADDGQEAASLKARSALLYDIRKIVGCWNLTDGEAARRLGLTGQQYDELMRGRLAAFSLEALVAISASAQASMEVKATGAA